MAKRCSGLYPKTTNVYVHISIIHTRSYFDFTAVTYKKSYYSTSTLGVAVLILYLNLLSPANFGYIQLRVTTKGLEVKNETNTGVEKTALLLGST